jgi:hypothetical protein
VPGSHDITRLACQAYFAGCEADDIEPRPPYWPKWQHFSRVFDEQYRDIDGVAFDRSQPWTLLAVQGWRPRKGQRPGTPLRGDRLARSPDAALSH